MAYCESVGQDWQRSSPAASEISVNGLQNRIVDDVTQGYFGFYDAEAKRLGAALAHSAHPLVDFLSLARTWPRLQPQVRDAFLIIARTTANLRP